MKFVKVEYEDQNVLIIDDIANLSDGDAARPDCIMVFLPKRKHFLFFTGSELHVEGQSHAFAIGERADCAGNGGFTKEVEAFLQKLFEVWSKEYGKACGEYAYAGSAEDVSKPVFVVINPSEPHRGSEGVGCNSVKG